MKTLSLLPIILYMLFSITTCFAQDGNIVDASLSTQLVGNWSHVSSTYPTGDVMTYHRDMSLGADGKGTCTKYMNGDTLTIEFEWEVKDSVVCLFVINKQGKRIDGDAQYISLVDSRKMYLSDAYGEDQMGKVCHYRRTGQDLAKY